MGVRHPEYVLAAAVACCAPMIPEILDGEVTAVTAGERFLVALVVCWILGSVFSHVYRNYSAQAQRAQIMRVIEADRAPVDTTAQATTRPSPPSATQD